MLHIVITMNDYIYLDNAATSGMKPQCVKDAVLRALEEPGSPNRGAHYASVAAMQTMLSARETACAYFDATDPERIIFTKNGTEALNIAIRGVLKEGDHVVTTYNEHNSVMRVLSELKKEGKITYTLVSPNADGCITAERIRAALQKDTRLVAVCAASNVSGGTAELREIGKAAHAAGALFLVDAAQMAGHERISVRNEDIDLFCTPAHKGLLAPMGLGLLAISHRAEPLPLIYGGTGSDSRMLLQPRDFPDGLEAGTMNTPAIYGLEASLGFLMKNGELLSEQLHALSFYLRRALGEMEEVELFASSKSLTVFSFRLKNEEPDETSDHLASIGIATRAGLHCAPLLHAKMGTEKSGLVRVGLSPFNTLSELKRLINALKTHVLFIKHR